MTEWEYREESLLDSEALDRLNELGAERWELVTVRERDIYDTYILKREVRKPGPYSCEAF